MWTAVARAGLAITVLPFVMWMLRNILDPVLDFATAGPHASDPSVVRIGSYFSAMTLDNLVLISGIGIAIWLLGRAAAERRLPG